MIRWLPQMTCLSVGPDTPEALAGLIRQAERGAEDAPVAFREVDALMASLDPDAVAEALRVPPAGEGVCAALPPRVWEHLLGQRDQPRARLERRWLPTPCARELPHQGASRGDGEEWWGWPAAALSGASYGDELWAWGVVRGPPGAPEISAWSPRGAWRAQGGAWIPDATLRTWVAQGSRPRPPVESGPGPLAAAVARGLRELPRAVGELTPGDRAALWAAFVLPLVAVSRMQPQGPPSALDLAPAFVYALPFHALHPQTQALVLAVERLCTCILAEDVWTLRGALRSLGRTGSSSDQGVLRAAGQRVRSLADRLIRPGSGERYDSGFGHRLVRAVCQEAGLASSDTSAKALGLGWDAVVHREEAEPGGHVRDLAGRLNAAFAALLAGKRGERETAAARALNVAIFQHWIGDDA